MRLFVSALCSAVALGLLAGCSNGSSSSAIPNAEAQSRVADGFRFAPVSLVLPSVQAGVARLDLAPSVESPATTGGIYGSAFSGKGCPKSCSDEGIVNGYPNPNNGNHAPSCDVKAYDVNGIAADSAGNLLVPGYFGSGKYYTINVYKGPGLCGKLLGSIDDTTGQPGDAATLNAATGKIYVTEVANNTSGVGDILVCTIKGGCGKPLTYAGIGFFGAGVTANKAGDCWLSTLNGPPPSGTALLVYWKGCKEPGEPATSFANQTYGGLFFDSKGNIDAIDEAFQELYVYRGCNPGCSNIGGPYQLKGASLFGGFNQAGNLLALGDVSNNRVDVYKYSPGGIKFEYSFNKGLATICKNCVESGVFAPSN